MRRLQSGALAKSGHRSSVGVAGLKCVSRSIELEPEATKTPTSKPFDISKDQKQKENYVANQFFSSLLEGAGTLRSINDHDTLF